MNWKQLISVAIAEANEFYSRHALAPTLRGLFYILVSKNVIPNTKSAYKRLSEVLSDARIRGEFPWHLLRDTTRVSRSMRVVTHIPDFDSIQIDIDTVKRLIQQHLEFTYSIQIDPWQGQSWRVIIAVEKEAAFEPIVRCVPEVGCYEVVFMRGYDSTTDLKRLANTVGYLNSDGHRVAVILFTDFDPTGEDIPRDFRERLLRIDPSLDVVVEKVAITKQQVQEYDLPCTPESSEEIEKMRRDPRFSDFHSQHGLMRVELDALISLKFDEFRGLVQSSILRYFDQAQYAQVKVLEQQLRAKADAERESKLAEVFRKLGLQ